MARALSRRLPASPPAFSHATSTRSAQQRREKRRAFCLLAVDLPHHAFWDIIMGMGPVLALMLSEQGRGGRKAVQADGRKEGQDGRDSAALFKLLSLHF